MKKLAKRLFFVAVIVGVIGYIGTYHIAPYAIIMKHETTFEVDFNQYDFKYEKVNLAVQDSIVLDSYVITPKTDSMKGIIIMVHGIGSCKEPFVNLAENLASKNIGTFLFDLRAHGKSGGKYCTYGYYEKNDIQEIVDYLKFKFPNKKIGIWGASLGGAIAIQSLELDARIEFGLIECTFTELDRIVYDYQKRICYGVGFKFITDASLAKAGEIAEFNPEEVKPINSVEHITQPVFLAHGDKDENISFEYGKLLFENLKSEEKTFVPIEGGGHNSLQELGGIEYHNKVMNFIDRQLEK
ncbi:MAG: alpha/beta fold hydrolase [Flavobacteriales bacterium]